MVLCLVHCVETLEMFFIDLLLTYRRSMVGCANSPFILLFILHTSFPIIISSPVLVESKIKHNDIINDVCNIY